MISTDFKDYLAIQMREMADNLAKQFLEKVGDQQVEERKKDQARQKKLEDDLKKEREARNKLMAEHTEKADRK